MYGVKPGTCNLVVLSEFVTFPIWVHQNIKMFKYLTFVIHWGNDKLLKMAFSILLQLHNCGMAAFMSCPLRVPL